MMGRRGSPFDLVARALSERFQGREPSAGLRGMVLCPRIDWERVVGYSSAQYVLPALAAALQDLNLIGSMDEELGAFLETVHAANIERNEELRDELATTVGILNRANIEPVLLKGAIRLVDGLYPDHGWRMLRDLDLLFSDTEFPEAIRTLEEAGYTPCGLDNEMKRPGGTFQIDLHSGLFSTARQARLLQAVDVLNGSRPVAFGDCRVRVPSIEHQLVHLVGHSQIRHSGHGFGHVALRDRLEAAALVHWGHESIDWPAVLARFVAAGYRRPLQSLLLSLNDGALCTVPVTGRIDPLTTLQQWRIALHARSTTFAYVSSRVGWWVSELKSQIEKCDAGQPRAINNLKRLVVERGAIWRMARAFMNRRRDMREIG